MSEWLKLVRILPFCIVFFIFTGLVACYIAFISIFDTQNDGRLADILFSFKSGSSKSNASIPEPKSNHWWINRHNHYVQTTLDSNGSIPIIFYGDSIVEGWASNGHAIFRRKYAVLGAVNYGISADRVEHLLWRIQNGEIDGLSPKLVVLMIGVNNLVQAHQSDDDIANGIATIVDYLRNKLSNTKILLLSILPRTGHAAFTRITQINRNLSKLADESTVFYLDMFNYFASPTVFGIVDDELYYDGLHLTAAGYKKWASIMDPLFNQLLSNSE